MNKLIMLVGLPGSGKSTYGLRLLEKMNNSILLSSDTLREELFNDINNTDSHGILFEELHKRVKEALLEGKNVIYDATNVSSKRRRAFILNFKGKAFKGIEFQCHYVNTPTNECIYNNENRERKVPTQVILDMEKRLTVPMYSEGWSYIKIVRDITIDSGLRKSNDISECVLSYEEFIEEFKHIPEFAENIDLPQDSKYHSLSVSRHIYYVYKYIAENYEDDLDFKLLLYAGIFHDIGKARCKNFKEESRYANFIGHENVSGQIALKYLIDIGFSLEDSLYIVELIQLHMRLNYDEESGEISANKKFENQIDSRTYSLLERLKRADMSAK